MSLTRFAVIASLLSALTLNTAVAQPVYKSVDRDGNISYSDEPPKDGIGSEVEIAPGPSEEQVKQAQERGREFQASVDKMVAERQREEALQLEKRRLREQQQRDRETEERLARLEEQAARDRYRSWGAYYPIRPYPPLWGGKPDHPEHPIAKPLPGLPPVTGLDGTPLFKSHRSSSRGGRF